MPLETEVFCLRERLREKRRQWDAAGVHDLAQACATAEDALAALEAAFAAHDGLPAAYPMREIVTAAAVEGSDPPAYLVTLECGHKKATRERATRYECRECRPKAGGA